jgi:hypothetical protein
MKERLERFGAVSSDLTRRWAQRRAGAVRRYGDILTGYGRGELSSTAAGEALARLAVEESVRYSEEVIEFGSDYVREVLKLAGVETPRGRPSTEPAERRIDIQVKGTVGSTATRSFLLENKQEVTADISFLVSDFTGPDGKAAFHAPIDFVPPRLTLRPHEEKAIELRLPLDDALFDPGKTYRARIIVEGYDSLEIGLEVEVVAGSSKKRK